MTHVEPITKIIKLNLKLQCSCQVYVIISMCTYILVSGTITIIGAGDNDNARRLEERNKKETYKNCVPFTDCISIRNNTQIDNAKELDVVMPMYNLIEYSENYSKTSGLFSTLQRWSKW